MYAGVIRSAVHTTFRRSLTIATVHARFNLTQIAYEGRKKSEPLHLVNSAVRECYIGIYEGVNRAPYLQIQRTETRLSNADRPSIQWLLAAPARA